MSHDHSDEAASQDTRPLAQAPQSPQAARGWRVTFVDPSTSWKVARNVQHPELVDRDAGGEVRRALSSPTRGWSRRDRQIALIMLIVEAARRQRTIAARTRRASTATRPMMYLLLTAKSLRDLVSDVLLLMNPALAQDFTAATTAQVHGLNLFHPP